MLDHVAASTDTDRAVDACARGDARAAEELFDRYRSLDMRDPARDNLLDALAIAAKTSSHALDVVIRIVYSERFVRSEIRKVLINDNSAAEEALQETALAMLKALTSFRGESTFRTWVSNIGRNQAIAVLRRKRPTVPLDERTPGSEVARYSSLLADRADIDAALHTLSDEFRETVRLRDVEHRSYQEIADLLGVKLNTVRSRLARGRAQLALALEPGR